MVKRPIELRSESRSDTGVRRLKRQRWEEGLPERYSRPVSPFPLLTLSPLGKVEGRNLETRSLSLLRDLCLSTPRK